MRLQISSPAKNLGSEAVHLHFMPDLSFYIVKYDPPRKMEAANMSAEVLRQQISDTEARLRTLRDQLASIEENESTAAAPRPQPCAPAEETISNSKETKWPLTPEEYSRYGRQMIVPRIGIQGLFLLLGSLKAR